MKSKLKSTWFVGLLFSFWCSDLCNAEPNVIPEQVHIALGGEYRRLFIYRIIMLKLLVMPKVK